MVNTDKGPSFKSTKKKSQELVETSDTSVTIGKVKATGTLNQILHKQYMATIKTVQMEPYPSTLIVAVI